MNKVVAWIAALLLSFVFPTTRAFADTSEAAEFKFLFLKAAENYNETVDIKDLNLTKTEISNNLIGIFARENVWYLDTQYAPIDVNADGIVGKIRLYYRVPQEEIGEKENLIESEIENIISLTDGYSNPEKIKIVYDYFIKNYSYDNTLMNYDICRLFETKQGTCAALSLAYKEVMNRLNIPCEIKVNNDMSHEWIKVYVNDGWKNIDVTKGIAFKNTNVPNAEYRAFLLSDEILRAWGYKF